MRKALKTIVLLLILSVLVCLATVLGQGWFRFQREIENMPLSTAVAQYTDKDDYVVFEDIDDDFVKAVISVEDKRFFDRQGYDFVALIRAFYNNFRAGRVVEGGSTITEQIAKNLYLGGYVNGIEEKTAEIFIMLDLEKEYSKEDLFALYANMNYYGDGYWGIRDAAKGYYAADAGDLTLAEAAILAGIPNAPSILQLSTGYDLAKERQAWVLQTMVNNGYISEDDMETALLEDVRPVS
ncbi:MAG: transglycosylase domain-containing protein [Erysipelotrichaceae bacterium]|nr:transglycosylase domain-containing protein [Erysipelotrichaceae bacterium]